LGFIFELGRPVAEMYTPICEEAVDIPPPGPATAIWKNREFKIRAY
jgi:hypothetical protein